MTNVGELIRKLIAWLTLANVDISEYDEDGELKPQWNGTEDDWWYSA